MALVFSIHCLGVSVKLLRPASFPNPSNSTGIKSALLKWREDGDFLQSFRVYPHNLRIHPVHVRRDFQAGGQAFSFDEEGVIPGCIVGIGHAREQPPLHQPLQIVTGQQRGVLRPFQEGADIFADCFQIQCSQPFPHQFFPG